MNFEVSLEHFSGPLDLMLFLIKDKKLDLFDLDIVVLTDQYMAFLDGVREQKLEIASEYLSELAGLIEYKSKKLLPRDKSELEAKDVEGEEADLVKRLIEYQRYKEVSIDLAKRYEERTQQYAKPFSSDLFRQIKKELKETIQYEQTPYDLMNAMQKVMERFRIQHPHDVSIERVELSVDDVIVDLRSRFKDGVVYELETLLFSSPNIQYLLVSFLAVLDMLRMGELSLSYQDEKVYLKGVL